MKTFTIIGKEIRTRLRDLPALLLTLVAPLILAAIIAVAFSGLSGDEETSPITDVDLTLVNEDTGAYGSRLVDVLIRENTSGVLAPTTGADLDAARAALERGDTTAVVYIPPDFSAGVQAVDAGAAESARVQVFANPASPYEAAVVESTVQTAVASLNRQLVAARTAARKVAAGSEIDEQEVQPAAATAVASVASNTPVRWNVDSAEGAGQISNTLAYMLPGLAVFFLFFTMFDNINSILTEEREGTFARLLTTDTLLSQVLLGKIGGAFIVGAVQFTFLVAASVILFRLSWGQSPIGLILMAVATVAAVTSLGTFLAAFARNLIQANIMAGVVMFIFAALGGSFFPTDGFPSWLKPLSALTLNHWAVQGLVDLTMRGQSLNGVLVEAGVLLGVAVVLFSASLWRYPNRIAS